MWSYSSACETYLQWAGFYWRADALRREKEAKERLLSKVYRIMKEAADSSGKFLYAVVDNPSDYTMAGLLEQCSTLPGYQFLDELIHVAGEIAYIIWATPKAEDRGTK